MVHTWRRGLWWHGDPLCHRRAGRADPAAFDLALGRGWRWWARRTPPFDGDGCRVAERPCRYFRCPMHLAAEVTVWGSLRLLHPGVRLDELSHTCALEAARTQLRTATVAHLVGLSRAQTWRTLRRGLRRLKRRLPADVDVRAALAAAGCDTLAVPDERGSLCAVRWFG